MYGLRMLVSGGLDREPSTERLVAFGQRAERTQVRGLVLAWLWCRALGEMCLGKAVSVSMAVGITLLYAGFDEWYQGSVPGRTASLTDWILDAVGVAAGSWLYLRQLAVQSLTAHRP